MTEGFDAFLTIVQCWFVTSRGIFWTKRWVWLRDRVVMFEIKQEPIIYRPTYKWSIIIPLIHIIVFHLSKIAAFEQSPLWNETKTLNAHFKRLSNLWYRNLIKLASKRGKQSSMAPRANVSLWCWPAWKNCQIWLLSSKVFDIFFNFFDHSWAKLTFRSAQWINGQISTPPPCLFLVSPAANHPSPTPILTPEPFIFSLNLFVWIWPFFGHSC